MKVFIWGQNKDYGIHERRKDLEPSASFRRKKNYNTALFSLSAMQPDGDLHFVSNPRLAAFTPKTAMGIDRNSALAKASENCYLDIASEMMEESNYPFR